MPAAPPPLALGYHAVAAVPLRRDPHRLFTSPRALGRHVRRLRSYGYRFVTVGELARQVAAGSGEGCVALSFDDGFADQLLDVVADTGLPCTVFAVSGWLGGEHPDAHGARIAGASELRALHAAGVEIGGHTVTHPDLTTLSPDRRLAELAECRRTLEEIIDAPVLTAAYPYGAADPATREACAAAGYRAAVRTEGHGSWSDPFDLPRQNMLNGCSTAGLRLKRDGRYEEFVARPVPRRIRRWLRRARGHRRPAAR
jgi:peptidoglycan/xylan/chitin deacetylase (PgdA/CDA1 family)